MCIFKKKTTREEYLASTKRQSKYQAEIDKLSKTYLSQIQNKEKLDKLKNLVEAEERNQTFLLTEQKNPAPVPSTIIDNSKKTFKIGSDNTTEAKLIAYNKEGEKISKKSKTITQSKNQKTKGESKIKLIVGTICVLVLAGCLIFFTVEIKNCIDSHNNSAYVYSAIY